MLTNDQKEILITYFSTVLECYKVLTACLLSIFVPQFCPETNATCTLSENFTNLTQFNEFVITMNFTTLACFIYLYYIQSKRETYIINHLEVNKNKSDNSLEENLKSHAKGEKIFKRIKDHNIKVYLQIKRCMGIFYLNVLFSCILIFYYYYDGFRSVTSLIAYVLLISQKLYYMYSTMKNGTTKGDEFDLALSLTRLEPISYNDIDPDYIESRKSMIESVELEKTSEKVEIPIIGTEKEMKDTGNVPDTEKVSETQIDVKQSPKKLIPIEIENDNILEQETNVNNILNEISNGEKLNNEYR